MLDWVGGGVVLGLGCVGAVLEWVGGGVELGLCYGWGWVWLEWGWSRLRFGWSGLALGWSGLEVRLGLDWDSSWFVALCALKQKCHK